MNPYGQIPPFPPTITGLKKAKAVKENEYNFFTTDLNGHDVFYHIESGDETSDCWLDPLNSNEVVKLSYTWDKAETYKIKARAKDTNDMISGWRTLSVTVTRGELPNTLFMRLLERFPNIFPILRYILVL